MYCDHDWVEEEEPEDWPTPENGWYYRCLHCGKWSLQRTEWEEDYEIPIGDPIILTPKGWIEEEEREISNDMDTVQ